MNSATESEKNASSDNPKPKAERATKKAAVIAMMKRSKGGEKIESSKNAAGERTYKIGK